jgi:hypothetical protein
MMRGLRSGLAQQLGPGWVVVHAPSCTSKTAASTQLPDLDNRRRCMPHNVMQEASFVLSACTFPLHSLQRFSLPLWPVVVLCSEVSAGPRFSCQNGRGYQKKVYQKISLVSSSSTDGTR